jgi:hypothetical protein
MWFRVVCSESAEMSTAFSPTAQFAAFRAGGIRELAVNGIRGVGEVITIQGFDPNLGKFVGRLGMPENRIAVYYCSRGARRYRTSAVDNCGDVENCLET